MRVSRAGLGLTLLMLPTFLVAMDMTALLLALPKLSASLGASGVQQLWISDSYGFMVAGLVITMGTLGDRIGRRRLLMTGAAGFAAASVAAAFAVSPLMLIVARALLGVAGATLAPSTLALITNMFSDERRRGKAIAMWATCQFTGGALGPVLAGFLLQHFWWGSVFLINVPAMVALVIAGRAVLPEFRSDQAGRLDPASVGLSLVAVLLVVYGIKQLAVASAPAGPAAALLAGAAIGFGFVRRQLRLDTPLLDLRLLRNRPPERAGLLAAGLGGVVRAHGPGGGGRHHDRAGADPVDEAGHRDRRRAGRVGGRQPAADRDPRGRRPAAADDRHRRPGPGHRPAVRAGHRAGGRVGAAAAGRLGGVDVGDRQLPRRLARLRAARRRGRGGLPEPDGRPVQLAGRRGRRQPAPARPPGRGAAGRRPGGVHRQPARHRRPGRAHLRRAGRPDPGHAAGRPTVSGARRRGWPGPGRRRRCCCRSGPRSGSSRRAGRRSRPAR